jgi:3-hydroxybutyryl-CoA dehydratase
LTYEDFIVGFSGTFSKAVTAEDNRAFAQLSGDFNPVHFDDGVARELGFPAAISNGFVTESRVAAALVRTFGSERTIVVALEKNTRFLKPVLIGDEITARVEVVGRIEARRALKIRAGCFNARGEQVASTDMTILVLPRRRP